VITKVKLRSSSGGDGCGPDDGDGNCQERWVAIFGTYNSDGDPAKVEFYNATALRGKTVWMVDLKTGDTLGLLQYNATESQNNHSDMNFSFGSEPAVIDTDFDGFADVVYIGDLGGQLWKWDISAIGEDTVGGDGRMDNWPSEIWFKTPGVTVAGPATHYRSFWNPPAAAFVDGTLYLTWGSGERLHLFYEGDHSADDNNRFYVVKDPYPASGASSAAAPVFPATPLSESNLTDITNLATDPDTSDSVFYFTLPDDEKAVTKLTIFGGQVIGGTFTPETVANTCDSGSGSSNLYVFDLATGAGFFRDPSDPDATPRSVSAGPGFPSDPTVVLADDPANDKIVIKSSDGPRILTFDAPDRDPGGVDFIYWRVVD
jgi:type IV pilus assembly protein PilY1